MLDTSQINTNTVDISKGDIKVDRAEDERYKLLVQPEEHERAEGVLGVGVSLKIRRGLLIGKGAIEISQ